MQEALANPALSGEPVTTSPWDSVHEVPHVRLGQDADLVFVAPATADLLARAATGQADDLLTSVLLTARCPVVFAPAMHTEMWEHPATQANVATLRERGCLVLEPADRAPSGAAFRKLSKSSSTKPRFFLLRAPSHEAAKVALATRNEPSGGW